MWQHAVLVAKVTVSAVAGIDMLILHFACVRHTARKIKPGVVVHPLAQLSCTWRPLRSRSASVLLPCRRLFSSSPGKELVDKPSTLPARNDPKEVAESIENILVRSRRDELIKQVGPEGRRYLPTEDPNAFLLPDSKLVPTERRWQKVFVSLPWLVFAFMVAAPFLLVRTNLPWLQERSKENQISSEYQHAVTTIDRVPSFEVVNFSQMADVLERPYPTILLLFDSTTFMSKLFLPTFHDLEGALRATGLLVSVVALDLNASPNPPDGFLWEYPKAAAPHIQLIVPRGQDGETGVIDYSGNWSVSAIAEAARQLVGPYAAKVPTEELGQLDERIRLLQDTLFEVLFVEDTSLDVPTSPRQGSWWRWFIARPQPIESHSIASNEVSLAGVEHQLNLNGSLDDAIVSCQEMLQNFRARRPP